MRNLLLLICVFILMISGCKQSENTDKNKMLQIAVIPKGTSVEYWKSVHFGAEKAAKELGNVEIIWRGPDQENDVEGQKRVVSDMVTRQVAGIAVAPCDKDSLIDAVNDAIEEGIPVVVFDSGIKKGPKIVSYVATDNFKGGQLAADQLAKSIEEKGNVILLRYQSGSQSTEQREEGFLDGIKKYPNIKVISDNQRATDASSAKEKTDQLLQKHGDDLDGIFTVCGPLSNGTLESLRSTDLTDKVKFIGFDKSNAVAGLKDGSCVGVVLQDPVDIGYQAVMTLAKHLKGESCDKFTATGVFVATQENCEEQKIKALLNPGTLEP